MKAKIFVVGLVALLMVAGLVMISCKNPCEIEAGECGVNGTLISVCSSSDCSYNKFFSDSSDTARAPSSCSCK